MLFERVKGYDVPVVAGVLGTRRRAALLLGAEPERVAFALLEALEHPVAPALADGAAPCQEVAHRAPLDLRRLIPAPTNTRQDAGPYITMGLLRARDPDTGEADVTIHRLCVQGPDRLSVYFAPGRHIDAFRAKAESRGLPLPVSISTTSRPVFTSSGVKPLTKRFPGRKFARHSSATSSGVSCAGSLPKRFSLAAFKPYIPASYGIALR
jgi:UbiD family decarboxylase